MADAKRDLNRVPVTLAVTDDGSQTPTRLIVDPSTKRLKVIITNASLPATSTPTGKRDVNRVPTVFGVTDDAAQTVTPIGMDSDGNILIDLLVE